MIRGWFKHHFVIPDCVCYGVSFLGLWGGGGMFCFVVGLFVGVKEGYVEEYAGVYLVFMF